jgi:hypothetical protein
VCRDSDGKPLRTPYSDTDDDDDFDFGPPSKAAPHTKPAAGKNGGAKLTTSRNKKALMVDEQIPTSLDLLAAHQSQQAAIYHQSANGMFAGLPYAGSGGTVGRHPHMLGTHVQYAAAGYATPTGYPYLSTTLPQHPHTDPYAEHVGHHAYGNLMTLTSGAPINYQPL